jgi:hypothetical protein
MGIAKRSLQAKLFIVNVQIKITMHFLMSYFIILADENTSTVHYIVKIYHCRILIEPIHFHILTKGVATSEQYSYDT